MPERKRKIDELPGAIAMGRSIRGWSQRRLAKASGVAQSWISYYERGLKTPTMRSLERIAAALGVSAVDLFELAAIARRFRSGESGGGGSGHRPAPARLRSFPNLGREIAALLAAEAARAGVPPPLRWPERLPETPREVDELAGAIALGRSVRGFTRTELAAAAGVRQASLADYERGRKTPTPGSLERIARALDVSAADLFDLAAVVRRFRSGGARPGPEWAGRGRFPHLEREIATFLAAEVATAYEPAPRPDAGRR